MPGNPFDNDTTRQMSPFEKLMTANQVGSIGDGLMPRKMYHAYKSGQEAGTGMARALGLAPTNHELDAEIDFRAQKQDRRARKNKADLAQEGPSPGLEEGES